MKVLLWIFIAVITGLYIVLPVIDPDLWWHIAIGRWIVANGEVPHIEYWNAFGLGEPFRAYSWMAEVPLALIDSRFGFEGLFYAKILLGQAISFVLCYTLSRLSGDWFIGLLLGVIGLLSCYSHFTLRPQSVTWIYFSLLILLTDNAVRRERLFPDAIGILVVLSLWANIHITTIIGLAAIFFWSFTPKRLALTGWLIFFGILGTLLTPYVGAEWLTFFSKTGHPLTYSLITEFQPATVLQYASGFVLLVLTLGALLFAQHPTVFAPFRLIYAGILVLGGFAIIKFLPYASIFLLAVIASAWREAKERELTFGNLEEGITKLRELIGKIPTEGLGFILLSLIVVLGTQLYRGERVGKGIVPVDAVNFMEEKGLEKPWLNTFGYGGYMMRHFTKDSPTPSDHVFIDGRTNVTPKDVAAVFSAARSGKREWRELLDLTQPNAILWNGDTPLISLLLLTKEWCVGYEAPEAQMRHTVMIKRETYNARPDDFPGAFCEEVSEEPLLPQQ